MRGDTAILIVWVFRQDRAQLLELANLLRIAPSQNSLNGGPAWVPIRNLRSGPAGEEQQQDYVRRRRNAAEGIEPVNLHTGSFYTTSSL